MSGSSGRRRRSRFGDAAPATGAAAPGGTTDAAGGTAAAVAAARAAAARLAGSIGGGSSTVDPASGSASRPGSRFGPAVPAASTAAAASTGDATAAAAVAAAKLQAKIQAQLAAAQSQLNSASMKWHRPGVAGSRWGAGRAAPGAGDKSSGLQGLLNMPFKREVATLKVNQREVKKRNPYLDDDEPAAADAGADGGQPKSVAKSSAPGIAVGVDPRISTRKREMRGQRALKWVEEGRYLKAGEQARDKAERRVVYHKKKGPGTAWNPKQVDDDAAAGGGGAERGDANLVPLGDGSFVNGEVVPPRRTSGSAMDMEWWDVEFLPEDVRKLRAEAEKAKESGKADVDMPSATHAECKLTNAKTWAYVEVPAPVEFIPRAAPKAMPLMLTKKEQKKLRRRVRAERHKEKQDKIRYGLLPPPEPKMKISTFMKIKTDEGVMDPTALERKVREQMAQRVRNHDMRNLAKKLTPAERKEKLEAKLTATEDTGIHVALFRVMRLTNQQHVFKVDRNAKDLMLTGVVLHAKSVGVNMVLVEGGRLGVKKFVRLMTHRIKWHEKTPGEAGSDEESDSEAEEERRRRVSESVCQLLWQGTSPKRQFSDFRFEECNTIASARRAMDQRGLAPHWDRVVEGISESSGGATQSSKGSDADVAMV